MTADELFARLLEATSRQWHWWHFHFQTQMRGTPVPFVEALTGALLEVDAVMPGYAARTADVIGGISGRAWHRPDYEQLLQRLAEIHVALHLVRLGWPPGTTVADEPVAPGSARNPEMVVTTPEFRLGVEVKSPSLLRHQAQRNSRPVQSTTRVLPLEQLSAIAGGPDRLTRPRDNPVKDFLASADEKFAAFRANDDDFYGILTIVWDDFVFEPISALLHQQSGLLTEGSFARDSDGRVVRYSNVDAVLLVSHLQYLEQTLAEDGARRPFGVAEDVFRWDRDPARPVAIVPVPGGRALPEGTEDLLQVRPLDAIPGAEYDATDLVMWTDSETP